MMCCVESVRSWFVCRELVEIHRDVRTPGIMGAEVQEFDRFGDCFCTYVLMIWSVLLQLASEQDSTLNMSFVYLKTKVFVKILN